MPRRSRYREVQARRAERERRDAAATRATTQIAALGVALVFLLVIVALLNGPGALAPLRGLARPAIGDVTWLELGGYGFVAFIGITLWRRLRR